MVRRSGVGPSGCPIATLTVEKLVNALEILRSPETIAAAQALGARMDAENGVAAGVECFYRNLPVANMACEVSLFDDHTPRIARVYCPTCGLKMSLEADRVVHRKSGGRDYHLRVPYRASRWGVVPPSSVLEGLNQGVGVAAYEMAGGLWDLFTKPIIGAMEKGATGAAEGVAQGIVNFIARPVIGGQILLERVMTGALSSPRDDFTADENLDNPPALLERLMNQIQKTNCANPQSQEVVEPSYDSALRISDKDFRLEAVRSFT